MYFINPMSDWMDSVLTGTPVLPSYKEIKHNLFIAGSASLACSNMRLCVLNISASTTLTPFSSFSQMILFSACCICGLIGGILNFQFLRAVTKKTSSLYPLHLASMSLACIGIGGCTVSSWLTCRLASYEQRRMFSEREHSLHHSHEMAEKVSFFFHFASHCCHAINTII